MSDGLRIRPARLGELDAVLSMYEWLFAPPGAQPTHWDPERAAAALRRVIAAETSVVLIAEHDGELVGLCTAYEHLESVRFGRRVWVEDLAVHPERRSLGVGRRLLDAAREWARSRDAVRLGLESSVARTDAHRFYERESPDSRSLSFSWQL